MGCDINKVISIANAEVGYLEKNSKANLNNKTADAGNGNYTKYWADLEPSYQGQPWCNCFVNWIFVSAYGVNAAKNLLCTTGGWSYYTPASAQNFKNKNQWYSKPQKGDIIYFKNSKRIHHVGFVYAVDSTKVYTIEGNTSAGSAVIANGGGVAKKSYLLSNSSIAGYGRPNYGNEVTEAPQKVSTSTYTQKDFIKEVQEALGVTADGIAGPKTLAATITISRTKNNTHAVVKPIQKYLNSLGYNCGAADGEAGPKFDIALKSYQKQWMQNPDGEITGKNITWKKLLGLI